MDASSPADPMMGPIPSERNLVCWTRVQSEAGQDIKDILARKEIERLSGKGVFFWGVGNSPSRAIRKIAARGEEVPVIFSLMKTRPKLRDVNPGGILVWRGFVDEDDVERPVPPHVLVTSRSETETGQKSVHYAIVCHSEVPLRLGDLGPFDPTAYRNLGGTGAPVSNSQVTALLLKVAEERPIGGYRINFRASLTGGYWVRMTDPCPLVAWARQALSRTRELHEQEWLDLVTRIRVESPGGNGRSPRQSYLFRLE